MGSKSSKVTIDIYWNLHKECWSVRYNGKVTHYANDIVVKYGANFVVQPAGRDRVLREKRKNVHAFVRTNYQIHLDPEDFLIPREAIMVSYNPYKAPTFVEADGTPIFSAKRVYMTNKRCYVVK